MISNISLPLNDWTRSAIDLCMEVETNGPWRRATLTNRTLVNCQIFLWSLMRTWLLACAMLATDSFYAHSVKHVADLKRNNEITVFMKQTLQQEQVFTFSQWRKSADVSRLLCHMICFCHVIHYRSGDVTKLVLLNHRHIKTKLKNIQIIISIFYSMLPCKNSLSWIGQYNLKIEHPDSSVNK